jgi:hypothetical protein
VSVSNFNNMKNLSDAKERKRMRSNLRKWWTESTFEERQEGLGWYSDAQEFAKELSTRFNVSREVSAGVISALSPNNRWERNKVDAIAVFEAVQVGVAPDRVKVCTYNANKEKAFEIAKGNKKILKQSPKTYAFARNVGEMDNKFVTIDKWHLRACQTTSKSPRKCKESCTAKQYRLLQEDCIKVAGEYGIDGHVFQATIWTTIRNRWSN